MARRYDAETIRVYAEISATLEALRIATQALAGRALDMADCEPCQSAGLDELHQPNNAVLDIMRKLRRDLNDRIYMAKEAIQTDLHSVYSQGRTSCPPTEFGT